MRAYVLYHDPCWDGSVAAAIAKNFFSGAPGEKYSYIEYIPFNYKYGLSEYFRCVLCNDDSKPEVYLLDISFDPSSQKSMADLSFLWSTAHAGCAKIYWLDHHDSSFESYDLLLKENPQCRSDPNFLVTLTKEKSGALLAWDFFSNRTSVHHRIGNKSVIDKISDYDTWQHLFPDTASFNAGVRRIFSSPTIENAQSVVRYTQAEVTELTGYGKIVLEEEKKTFERIAQSSFALSLAGREFVAVAHSDKSTTSNLSAFLYNTYNKPTCVFLVKYDGVELSFRSRSDLGEVLSVAKAFGGGGHNYACGANVTYEVFDEVIRKGRKHD